jgi:hypothetical protein
VIFVGVSINLAKILSIVSLPERALISLILLFSILIRSLLFLVPDKKLSSLGLEILITGSITWLIVTFIDINIIRKKEKEFKRLYFLNFFLNQIALLPYFISGFLLMNEGITQLDWLVLAFIFSYVKAMLDAWVLLVEINR